MLFIDPEREAAGQTVATMLVAKEIRHGGRIHLETILTEIGALAGCFNDRSRIQFHHGMQRRFVMTAIIGNTASLFQPARLFLGVPGSAASSRASAPGTSPATTGGASSSADPAVRGTGFAQARLASLLVLPDDVAKSLAEDQKRAADLLAILDQAKKSMISDLKGAALEKLTGPAKN